MWMQFLPFEEADSNPALQAYVDAGVQVPIVMPLPWGPDRNAVIQDTLEACAP